MRTASNSWTFRWQSSALVLAVIAFAPAVFGTGAANPEELPGRTGGEALDPAASITLRVDLGERRLRVIEGGRVTKTYIVSVGKQGHRTPQGTYSMRRIQWNPSWVPPPNREWARGLEARGPGDPRNPMGRVKIFFREPTYFIHGTPDEGSLGGAVSHGCIRMRNADAIELAKLLMERGGRPEPASWFERVLGRADRTQEVTLPRPVTLTVRG